MLVIHAHHRYSRPRFGTSRADGLDPRRVLSKRERRKDTTSSNSGPIRQTLGQRPRQGQSRLTPEVLTNMTIGTTIITIDATIIKTDAIIVTIDGPLAEKFWAG